MVKAVCFLKAFSRGKYWLTLNTNFYGDDNLSYRFSKFQTPYSLIFFEKVKSLVFYNLMGKEQDTFENYLNLVNPLKYK